MTEVIERTCDSYIQSFASIDTRYNSNGQR